MEKIRERRLTLTQRTTVRIKAVNSATARGSPSVVNANAICSAIAIPRIMFIPFTHVIVLETLW
ncbi:hypothetical protein [Vibrio sp. 10N.261.51.F12]|uniref:hypothetical protein n=1 Tax=Vibrio sp. 10N.261.51.F12 TaxID=3229679 RepID=UPI003551AAD4